jgi:hypothetical protein
MAPKCRVLQAWPGEAVLAKTITVEDTGTHFIRTQRWRANIKPLL